MEGGSGRVILQHCHQRCYHHTQPLNKHPLGVRSWVSVCGRRVN